MRPKQTKNGNIILNGVKPAVHEYAAYLVLANHGKIVSLLLPSSKYKAHSADFEMDSLIWELKSPKGKGKYTIRDTIKQAIKQSDNIVIDFQRLKLNQEKALLQTRKYFSIEKQIQRIIIITKEKTIIDIYR